MNHSYSHSTIDAWFSAVSLHLIHLRLQNKHLHRDMKKKPRVTEVSINLLPSSHSFAFLYPSLPWFSTLSIFLSLKEKR